MSTSPGVRAVYTMGVFWVGERQPQDNVFNGFTVPPVTRLGHRRGHSSSGLWIWVSQKPLRSAQPEVSTPAVADQE